MRKGIHPLRKDINIISTDGSFISTTAVMTLYKPYLKLDIDIKKHPCWNPNKDLRGSETSSRLQRFKSKYV